MFSHVRRSEDGPVGIARIMERDPEEGTERDGEEEIEGEEPRIGELRRIEDRAEELRV